MQDVTYPPLNTLKAVDDDIWIVDGPAIRFGPAFLKMPFPTRMTVIRTGSDLFIHSPTLLPAALKEEIEHLGTPRWIVAPNRLHYVWLGAWAAAFPAATVFVAPRVAEHAGHPLPFPTQYLAKTIPFPWVTAIETRAVAGDYMTEYVFFHYASRSLVLTDLIENFEPDRLSLSMRLLTWIGGVQHPHGGMPRDMRLTYSRHKDELRDAVHTMIGWQPQRVIIAHGRWYERNGTAQLQRAFAWLLE
jgi:hypothetical protein